ncbi:hypothetical protein GH714_032375 [Hevea brasiliensis]|uniref:Uncharacterized protein n=1 Tax=Hevea brasiliensis TaxID=3981 RepID=A0A6A6M6E6_HEVBR|nr:hypothetical protein GH714_032375 [Hevea brasiliensis]
MSTNLSSAIASAADETSDSVDLEATKSSKHPGLNRIKDQGFVQPMTSMSEKEGEAAGAQEMDSQKLSSPSAQQNFPVG